MFGHHGIPHKTLLIKCNAPAGKREYEIHERMRGELACLDA